MQGKDRLGQDAGDADYDLVKARLDARKKMLNPKAETDDIGLCEICKKNKPDPGLKRCGKCLCKEYSEYNKSLYDKDLYRLRIRSGLCGICGRRNDRFGRRATCSKCYETQKEYRASRKRMHICLRCGKKRSRGTMIQEPTKTNRCLCRDCRMAISSWNPKTSRNPPPDWASKEQIETFNIYKKRRDFLRLQKNKDRHRARVEELTAKGLCIKCRKPRGDSKSKRLCDACREEKNRKTREANRAKEIK